MQTIDFTEATFIKSVFDFKDCPKDEGSEIAFAGRSNAGKSSLINVLTDQTKLASTSKTPGRTQCLNFFGLDLEDSKRLVDLPGYGYAKAPVATKKKWEALLTEYLCERHSLKAVVLIMDCRHPRQRFDEQMIAWALQSGMRLHMVLTKSDKLSFGKAKSTLLSMLKDYEGNPLVSGQLFSSLNQQGLGDLRDTLAQLL